MDILSEGTSGLKIKYFRVLWRGKRGKGRPSTSWTDDMKKLSGDGVYIVHQALQRVERLPYTFKLPLQ